MKNLNVPNKGNVPRLRFTGYTDEWKNVKIADIATIVGGGTPDTTISEYWDGDIQWFTPSEIGKSKYIAKSDRTITKEGLNNSSAKILPKGTILLSTRATIGECSIADKECCTNQGFQSIIVKNNTTNEFQYYLIQTKKKDLIRNACGSTFLEISANEVRKIRCNIPNIEEQRKIADFLSLLDKRIETQNKIIQQLQSLIKGIVVSVTAETPNTRIDKCLVCHSSTLQENQIDEFGGFPVYGANGICGYTDNADFNEPAILIVKDGSGVGNVRYVNGKYSVIGTQNILTPQNGYCLKYIFYSLQAFNFIPYKIGMAIPHIYFKHYGKAKIYCPNYAKQIEIAKQIENIEKKIELEKDMLLAYQKQKAYLLMNLFI